MKTMISIILAITGFTQAQVSYSTLPEASQASCASLYYQQTGSTNIIGDIASAGSVQVMLPNHEKCNDCNGVGKYVQRVDGEQTNDKRRGIKRSGGVVSVGHTGKIKRMGSSRWVQCDACGGDGRIYRVVVVGP